MKDFQKKYRTIHEAAMADIRGGTMSEDPAYLVGYLVSYGLICLIKSVTRMYDNFYPLVIK